MSSLELQARHQGPHWELHLQARRQEALEELQLHARHQDPHWNLKDCHHDGLERYLLRSHQLRLRRELGERIDPCRKRAELQS